MFQPPLNTWFNVRLVFFIIFILSVLFSGQVLAGKTLSPEEHFFDSTFGDFTEELETAKAEGKKGIFIFFEMDECPFCHWMKKNVLNQPEVQAFYKKHFLNFPVDIEGDIEITNFQGKHTTQKDFAFKENRVRATPVLAFFDLSGKRIMRYTGRTRNKDEFLLLGKFIAEGAYKTTKFSRYKRTHKP